MNFDRIECYYIYDVLDILGTSRRETINPTLDSSSCNNLFFFFFFFFIGRKYRVSDKRNLLIILSLNIVFVFV